LERSPPVVLEIVQIEEDGDPSGKALDNIIRRGDAVTNEALSDEHRVRHRAGTACDHFGNFPGDIRLSRNGDHGRQPIDESHDGCLDIAHGAWKSRPQIAWEFVGIESSSRHGRPVVIREQMCCRVRERGFGALFDFPTASSTLTLTSGRASFHERVRSAHNFSNP